MLKAKVKGKKYVYKRLNDMTFNEYYSVVSPVNCLIYIKYFNFINFLYNND